MKLKVCGMKYFENIQEVGALAPDYLGFIFYKKSKRYFDGILPELPETIQKVGVFVNASFDEILEKTQAYDLQLIQLHGDETATYIHDLKGHFERSEKSHQKKQNEPLDCAHGDNSVKIIKAFGIKTTFDFDVLNPYVNHVDYFLFDTKGKERGGNGIPFDWKVLENYPFSKSFFLSGGIGLDQLDEIREIRKTDLPIYALDVNSKFEIEAGLKNTKQLKAFKEQI